MTSASTVLISAVAAILVSPLLASWTIGLTDRAASNARWWQPRPVGAQRLILVATVAGILTAGAVGGVPCVAWWLFAAAGAVLCVVDVRRHLLPGRLVYPLAAVVVVAMEVSALVTGEPERLLRAMAAAAAIGAVWFGVAFAAPSAMGRRPCRSPRRRAARLDKLVGSAGRATRRLALGRRDRRDPRCHSSTRGSRNAGTDGTRAHRRGRRRDLAVGRPTAHPNDG